MSYGLSPIAEQALAQARTFASCNYPPDLLCAWLIKRAWNLPVHHFIKYRNAPDFFSINPYSEARAGEFLEDEELLCYEPELPLSGSVVHQYLITGFFIWVQLREPNLAWLYHRNCVVFLDRRRGKHKCFIPMHNDSMTVDLDPLDRFTSVKIVPNLNTLHAAMSTLSLNNSLERSSRTSSPVRTPSNS